MRRLMNWLLGRSVADEKAASERLTHAVAEQRQAADRHTKLALAVTLAADDTREALEALLHRMERRRVGQNEAHRT